MSPPHLLVVDDQPAIQRFVRKALERMGYRVTTASDGLVASTLLAHCAPDLVVLDLNLPGVPGWTIVRQIRATWTLPIILMSAHPRTAPVVQGLMPQVSAYLEKPFDLRHLLEVVHRSITPGQSAVHGTAPPGRCHHSG